MGWILGAMIAVILGLAIVVIVLWTELQEERERNFNTRVFRRMMTMSKPTEQDARRAHPSFYDQDRL